MDLRQLFSQLLGRSAEHMGFDDADTQQAVRLLSKVQMHMFGKWSLAQSTNLRCHQHVRGPLGPVTCVEPMSGACVACRQPVCLNHAAFVAESGDLVCFSCIGVAQRARANTPGAAGEAGSSPPPQDIGADDDALRKKYMKRLKLTGDPDENDIRAAFRREAAKAHPDRAPEGKKDKAHAKFVALGEARDWLLNHAKRKAAA